SGRHLYSHSCPTRRSSDLHQNIRHKAHHLRGSRNGFDRFNFLRIYNIRHNNPMSGRPFVKNTMMSVLFIVFLTKDRKSTRLNSSHVSISYAVFCMKKKVEGAIDPVILLLKAYAVRDKYNSI